MDVGITGRSAAALAASVVAVSVLHAQTHLKIGTIAPDGTPYVNALRAMGEAWKKGTAGRVTYAVQAGSAGEELVLRDLRGSSRRLQVAQLSAISLSQLDTAFNAFSLPMFFESYAEADRALDALTPTLEQRLEAKGLKVLNFAWAGWVHIFSKAPIVSVADLKKQPLFTSEADGAMNDWYKANNFTIKTLDATQLVPMLKTGMIHAAPSPPIYAQYLGLWTSAPNMMDVGFAPLLGATVMSIDAWKKISAEDQKVLLDEAKKTGANLRRQIPKLEREAIDVMKTRKLNVTTVDRAAWRREAETLAEAMRKANLIPGDVYDTARRERDAARAGK